MSMCNFWPVTCLLKGRYAHDRYRKWLFSEPSLWQNFLWSYHSLKSQFASIQIYSYPYKFCSATHDLQDQNLYACHMLCCQKLQQSFMGLYLKWLVRVNTIGTSTGRWAEVCAGIWLYKDVQWWCPPGEWRDSNTDWVINDLHIYRSFIILWQGHHDRLKRGNEGCTLGDPSAASETRPSIHSSNRTQAETNH